MEFRSNPRITGGTPNGMPDYRPFNKLSRDEQRKLVGDKLKPKPRLYQVYVDWVGRGTVPVGPKIPLDMADGFRALILKQITLGQEKVWANPTVLPASLL